jgi:hypothetical protein
MKPKAPQKSPKVKIADLFPKSGVIRPPWEYFPTPKSPQTDKQSKPRKK